MQEVANARRALLCCGTASIHAQIFALCPRLLGVSFDEHFRAVFELMPTYSREGQRKFQNTDFGAVLAKFRQSEASDPRDRIFALLGVCADNLVREVVKPDYSRSEAEVIYAAMEYFRLKDIGTSFEQCQWKRVNDIPNNINEFFESMISSTHAPRPRLYIRNVLAQIFIIQDMNRARTLLSQDEWRIAMDREMIRPIFRTDNEGVVEMTSLLLLHSWEFDMSITSLAIRPNKTQHYTGMYYCFLLMLADIARNGITSRRRKELSRLLSLTSGDYLIDYMLRREDPYTRQSLEFFENCKPRQPNPGYDQSWKSSTSTDHSETDFFEEFASFTITFIFGRRWKFERRGRDPKQFAKQLGSCGIATTIALYFAVCCRELPTVQYLLNEGVKMVIGQLPNPISWLIHSRDCDTFNIL